jgi:hypothetical protein
MGINYAEFGFVVAKLFTPDSCAESTFLPSESSSWRCPLPTLAEGLSNGNTAIAKFGQ